MLTTQLPSHPVIVHTLIEQTWLKLDLILAVVCSGIWEEIHCSLPLLTGFMGAADGRRETASLAGAVCCTRRRTTEIRALAT